MCYVDLDCSDAAECESLYKQDVARCVCMQMHKTGDDKTVPGLLISFKEFTCRDPLVDVASFEENGGNIIIGTPGRLTDVMKRSKLFDAKCLEVLVLDEADRLLSMGFKKQLDYIMGRLPKQRRTGG